MTPNKNHRGQKGHAGRPQKQMQMQAIDAPYNFVPLADWIYFPPWAPQVSHDLPFRDGFCGHLEVELTAKTPLLVGGRQSPASKDAPGSVEFCRTRRGYTIPGSSLKGMLRSVIEIAAFGRMRQVDDVRYAIRDISNVKRLGESFSNILSGNVKAGWLSKGEDGRPRIQPCAFAWLKHEDLAAWLGRKNDSDRPLFTTEHKGVAAKYPRWEQLCKQHDKDPHRIPFSAIEADADDRRRMTGVPNAVGLGSGTLEGIPVLTGQISDSRANRRTGQPPKTWKKRDFLFYRDAETPAESFTLSVDEWKDFRFVHGDDVRASAGEGQNGSNRDLAWPGYWKKRYFSNQRVPVFYVEREGRHSIGLAYMFKLAGDYSTADAIRTKQPAHLELPDDPARACYDLAELLFGTLGKSQHAALGSRISVASAFAAEAQSVEVQAQPPTVLNGPKASYFPNYLEQPAAPVAQYQTWMQRKNAPPPAIRGWKRYPMRDHIEQNPTPPPDRNGKENFKVQTQLKPVAAGTRFRFRIHFHNLNRIELGALLWSLQLGEARHRHALGMGKCFGFGQVVLELQGSSEIRPNDPAALTPQAAELIEAFSTEMDRAVQDQSAGRSWLQTLQLRQLTAMSDPAAASRFKGQLRHMRLSKPNQFVQARQDGLRLEPYCPGVPEQAAPRPRPAEPRKETLAWHTVTVQLDASCGKLTIQCPGFPPAVAEGNRASELRATMPQDWQNRLKKKKRAAAQAQLKQTEGLNVCEALDLKPAD